VQSFALPELKAHVRDALNCGANRDEFL